MAVKLECVLAFAGSNAKHAVSAGMRKATIQLNLLWPKMHFVWWRHQIAQNTLYPIDSSALYG